MAADREWIHAGPARIPVSELVIRFTRSRGPGGQNVNRRETRVEVVIDVGSSPSLTPAQRTRATTRLSSRLDSRGRLRVTSDAARTQAGNRDAALARMTELLAEALRPPPRPRVATSPGLGARTRRLESKRRRAGVKRLRTTPGADD